MVHLKITPDSRLNNEHVEQLAQTLCIYQSPFERWNGRGFNRKHFVSFETIIKKNQTSYVFTVLDEMEDVARKAIETAWLHCSVEKIADPIQTKPSLLSELTLQYNYFLALKVDRRQISHLQSILEVLNLMNEKDEIIIQSLTIPASPDWYQSAVDAYGQFKKGDMPSKIRFDKKGISKTGMKMVGSVILGTIGIMQELFTGEEPEKINLNDGERAMILRDGSLSSATIGKVRGDAYDTFIRIGVICNEPKRAHALMRSVTMSFRELDGDNSFVASMVHTDRSYQRMKERSAKIKLQADYLSIPEVSKLFMMPTQPLQERFHIPNIKQLETEIPLEIRSGGMFLGSHELKGKKERVFQPIDNPDLLCLPNVTIGPMGCGKTKGFAANWLVQAVQNGYGGVAIDPAKGEIGNEVEAVLSSDQIIRVKLGEVPIALDWCEVKYSRKAKNRLANTIISFFNSATDEAGAQTARYIRAAVMAMQTGRLSEIVRIFEEDEYRKEVIEALNDGMYKSTLADFSDMSDSKRAQILAPIYNRLDTVLGDEYLAECMESDSSLDMVELMSQRKGVIIDVPKSELGPEGVDLIVNLLSTKIDLAMTLREESNQFPFFVIFDEPHQFLRSAKTWKAAAVESRKWRVGYVWMFHSWEQIPRDLSEIVKSAGPHYHIYSGASKRTWKDLAEEIAPFTLEDALNLPRFHAVNILRTNDGMIPFISHMTKPPSEQK